MRYLISLVLILLITTNCLALQKNVASQKWVVFAFDLTDNTAKTGDAAQITAEISADGAAGGGNITDTNPTELEDGYYVFDISQGESNGDYLLILPESSTGNIQVIGVPMAVWTTPPDFPAFSIDSNGRIDIIKIAGTTQTANDNGADINAILIDTNQIQGKLPTNKFMGSSDGADDDGNINSILAGTVTNAQGTDVATDVAAMIDASNRVDVGSWLGQAVTLSTGNKPDVNIDEISDDTTAPGNLELRFDGTGYAGGTIVSQADITKIGGGAQSATDLKDFADAGYDPANNIAQSDLVYIHGSALSETNAGDLADSFGFFFDVDPTTTKTVDDVGSVASGGGSPLALTSGNLGDYKNDLTVYFLWRTVDQGGAAVNPTTAGTIKVYKADGTAEVTAPTGITDTRGFDSLTGIHLCIIDLSANSFYDIKQDYSVVLTGATIDSQAVTCVVATFGIENRFSEPQNIYGSLNNDTSFYASLTEQKNGR